tara:strand:- start:10271 stop:11461 length:1191 start_codon:yes stop_codon:yes gene_type:complete
MENRVYYGEYSLRHWIDLVLKNKLVLPDYQRFFVWDEKKVATLIETIKNKQFVPPITIGAFKIDGENRNLLLDGQQRITSIILAHLGLFPDPATYKAAIESFADDNDDLDSEEDIQLDNILKWNIARLTEKGNKKEIILSKITPQNYKTINLDIDDSFLDSNFLGFSYLVPHTDNEKEQQKYYSSVFRNINIQGEPLLPQESRASLYFLDHDLEGLFNPAFCDKIVIKLLSSESKADFVRYLSLLSQYHLSSDEKKVARSYKPKMEKLYEEYIYSAIGEDTSSSFGNFKRIFPDKKYQGEMTELESALGELEIFGEYGSIIEIDTYLFGLVYHILFKKKKIDLTRKSDLKDKLRSKIASFKGDQGHQKSPNNLTHLRARLIDSIRIYGRYLARESR